MHDQQKWIARWHEQGALSTQQIPAALQLAGIPPSRQEWRLWIDRLLLWLGVVALLTGLIFFVAANWSGMGRFAKFALAEAAMIIALVAYVPAARWRYGSAALLAASLALGALLALIGQTYQTGADPYELFTAWALLMLPWVLLARLPALWVMWLVVLHVAYVLYVTTFRMLWGFFYLEDERIFIGMVLFDGAALFIWEWLAQQGWEWMRGRWVPRLLALTVGTLATMLAIDDVFSAHRSSGGWYFTLYIVVLGALYAAYRYKLPDLFMLAGGALSVIVVVTSIMFRMFTETSRSDTGTFFTMGLIVLLMTAGAAHWLRQVARELKPPPPAASTEETTP